MTAPAHSPAPWSVTDRFLLAALLVVTALATLIGWRLFWFLTDDAFIAFRYVSNAVAGRGWVWNPEPFLPVEGYTSFLWVALLTAIWKLFGLEPPAVANWLSLVFGMAQLALVLRVTWGWLAGVAPTVLADSVSPPAAAPSRRWRIAMLGLVALGTVSNRTFLAWLSSGLETALFNLLLLAWWAVMIGPPRRGKALLAAALAASVALARPDGLLFAAATLGWIVVATVRDRAGSLGRAAGRLVAVAPLLVVALHLLWRHATYDAWVPNTYDAKHLGAWPESGLRYLASFVVEYSLWIWLFPVALWLVRRRRGGARSGEAELRRAAAASERPAVPSAARLRDWRSYVAEPGLATTVAWVSLALQLGYYTLIIGGDHFEYRVYSYLVPIVWALAAWLLTDLCGRGGRRAPALLLIGVLLSWPIPWTHWRLTRSLETRQETFTLRLAVAPHLPAVVRPLGAWFDQWQDWLIRHHVGMRHQEHKVFYLTMLATTPPRAVGATLPWSDRHVLAASSVGVAGWTLPNVAVIDLLGLNDRVIARSPAKPGELQMAHSRQAPEGYAECFDPDVALARGPRHGLVMMRERERPLRDDDIRACEARFAAARQ